MKKRPVRGGTHQLGGEAAEAHEKANVAVNTELSVLSIEPMAYHGATIPD